MGNRLLVNNEKGFALILALAMLAILSVLGAFVLMTSTTEVQISGNYNAGQQSFFAADRSLEAAEALVRQPDVQDIRDALRLNGIFDLNQRAEEFQYGRSGLDLASENSILLISVVPSPTDSIGSGLMNIQYAITVTGAFLNTAGTAQLRTRIEAQKISERMPSDLWSGADHVGGSSDHFISTDGG